MGRRGGGGRRIHYLQDWLLARCVNHLWLPCSAHRNLKASCLTNSKVKLEEDRLGECVFGREEEWPPRTLELFKNFVNIDKEA